MQSYNLPIFDTLPPNVPRRNSMAMVRSLARMVLKLGGWQVVGALPNTAKAVLIGVPHTSNIDGVWAIAMVLMLDLDVQILGKKQLFSVPILAQFLRWAGVRPIDRARRGSTLSASIEHMSNQNACYIALAPEGTRKHTADFRTGFYYLAHGAGVPIIPINLHYGKKQVQFLAPIYPTGDISHDMPKIYQAYHDVCPHTYANMCDVLKS